MNMNETVNKLSQTVDALSHNIEKQIEKNEQKLKSYEAASKRSFLGGVIDNAKHYPVEQVKEFIQKGVVQKSLTTARDSGGLTIPSSFVNDQSRASHLMGLRSLASVAEITTDQLELLKEKNNTQVGWVLETEQRLGTETTVFEKQSIPTHEIYAKPKISQKLLDDSAVDLEQWIQHKIFDAMTIQENNAFIHGDGVHKPKGILHYINQGIECFKTGALGAMTDADVLLNVIHSMSTHDLYGSCWIMSRSALSHVRLLKDPQTKQFLLQASLDAGFGNTLFGFPVYINDALDRVEPGKNSTPILFGNIKKGYQVVDRKDATILRDPYSAKPFVEFYATKRVGGDVVDASVIKAIQFSE